MLKLKNVKKVKTALAEYIGEREKNKTVKLENIVMEFGKQSDESGNWEAFFSVSNCDRYIIKANYDASAKKATFVAYKVWSGVKEV